MNSSPSQAISDDELHAFVDGQLSPAEHADLQVRLAQQPTAQATVLKWQQQRSALRCLYQDVLDEPIPSPLMGATLHAASAQQDVNAWWRWGGMAAGVVMAFGLGWLGSLAWHGDRLAGAPSPAMSKAQAAQDFSRQASFAHVVYSPEVRHPVEVAAADQAHLVQWLSKRLGRPLKVPHLSEQGYELVGGRLLPGDAGARAQFMFQNTAGTRITLYLGALNKTPAAADAYETGFHFATDGAIPNFYWIDQGFGYALAGPVPRGDLMKLAEAVFQQL
ncbi:MAG: anti-sigma factor [Pseudomonadota bacterium]